MNSQTTVLQVGGLNWATSAAIVEQTLGRRPGVLAVVANAVSQTANVTYDPDRTDIAELSGWVRDCGYHCAGQSVPEHVCDPMAEPGAMTAEVHPEHPTHEEAGGSAQEVMGHGGMSMDDMVADMRNRFLVAWIFFDGAYLALRAKTLDMMVLVAVGVGTGWLYSVLITLTGGGEVFYEAATVLTSFVLLGHWFEMRARGGANDAVRTLLELAPSMAAVLRGGEAVEVPTAEVQVGDLLLVRPGSKTPSTRLWRRGSPRSTSRWSPRRVCRFPCPQVRR